MLFYIERQRSEGALDADEAPPRIDITCTVFGFGFGYTSTTDTHT